MKLRIRSSYRVPSLFKGGSGTAARVSARATTVTFVAVSRGCRAALAAGISIGREPLDNTIAGKHAAVDGKVAANHERAHGCVLLSQQIRLIRQVGLVLASVDQDKASKAIRITVTLVRGVCPSSAPAEAY